MAGGSRLSRLSETELGEALLGYPRGADEGEVSADIQLGLGVRQRTDASDTVGVRCPCVKVPIGRVDGKELVPNGTSGSTREDGGVHLGGGSAYAHVVEVAPAYTTPFVIATAATPPSV